MQRKSEVCDKFTSMCGFPAAAADRVSELMGRPEKYNNGKRMEVISLVCQREGKRKTKKIKNEEDYDRSREGSGDLYSSKQDCRADAKVAKAPCPPFDQGSAPKLGRT